MGILRDVFLRASQSNRLRERLPRYRFVQNAVKRFMPGETIDEALDAAATLVSSGMPSIVTFLGENIGDASEARKVMAHYLLVLEKIKNRHLDSYISLKLTQLGFDLGEDLCRENFEAIVESAHADGAPVWVDMEGSGYVQPTIDLYRRVHKKYSNVGICLQAYLYRAVKDVEELLAEGSAIRLVKGAYAEPKSTAFQSKKDVDENYFLLAKMILQEGRQGSLLPSIATHDPVLIERIKSALPGLKVSKDDFEIQMLYGIQREQQVRLAKEGFRVRVLISYGTFWFPWYMRRLAERPANIFFVLKNIFSR